MKKEYTIESISKTRTYYKFTEPNHKGELIEFELSKCENSGGKHSLPFIWYKEGYTNKILETYWSVNVYVTDSEGCWGKYNPTAKLSNDKKRQVLDFNWVLEATEENKNKIIDKIYNLATA